MSWLAQEDPEVLRAALEIIEAWDDGDGEHTVSGVLGSSSPSVDETDSSHSTSGDNDGEADGDGDSNDDSPLVTEVKPLRPLEVKPMSVSRRGAPRELKPATLASTRHRRREEIIYLRNTVQELEKQLVAVQDVKSEQSESGTPKEDVSEALAVVWQGIATRQQRLRQKSELEQAKLRKLLETQMKVAQGLMKLMQKARRIADDESFPHPKRAKLAQITSPCLNEVDQLARVDQFYANMADVFAFAKFHDGTTKFLDIQVNDDGSDDVFIELREAWVVPFERTRVLDALWKYTLKKSDEKMRDHDHHVDAEVTQPDLVMRHFVAAAKIGALDCNFEGRVVIKRFHASEHDDATTQRAGAVITNMSGHPRANDPGDLGGATMREDTCMRVLPVPVHTHTALHETNDHRSLTQVQCSHRFRISFDDDSQSDSRRHAGVLTDLVLEKLKEDVDLKHETIETLLLGTR